MTQVTIGMPVYNGAATIRAALDTLLSQSFGDFVIVISDNGSSDGTEAICREYEQRDSRVRYVRQPVNLGAAMNFRFVLFEAQTPYFMWAAADDLWAPPFIATHLAVLEQNPQAVCSQSKVLFAADGAASFVAEGTYALTEDAARNAARFLSRPADNSRYYGLFRTRVLQAVFPVRSFYAVDWAVSAATLRFGTHIEVPELLMIRDTSDVAGYQRLVERDHRFPLWRALPLLFMTKWLLAGRHLPRRPATLYSLAKLNLHLGIRFAMYRLVRFAADRESGANRAIQAVVRPGLGSRVRATSLRVTGYLYAQAHRLWRNVPLHLDQREALKREVFRLLGRKATALPAYQGWVAAEAAPFNLPELPRSGWQFPVASEHPMATAIIVAHDDAIATLGLIDSLVRSSDGLGLEIVVVDNGSADVTSLFDRVCPGVVFRRLPSQRRYGEAARVGMQVARGDTLIFLEQHVLATPNFLRQMLRALHGAEMAGPLVQQPGTSALDPDRAYAREVDCFPAAFAIRRSSLEALESVRAESHSFIDASADIACRVHETGGRVRYWPRAVVTDHASLEPVRIADRAARKRLLYIDANTPMPDQNSGSSDALNLMRLFGDLGFLVTFVPEASLAHHGRYTEVLQELGVHVVYRPYVSSVRDLLQRIGPELDLVVLSRADIAAKYFDLVRQMAPRARIIFNTVDLHGLRLTREAELANNPRLVDAAEAARRSELALVAKADATIVLSTYERQVLAKELPEANVHVVPLVREVPEQLEVPGFAQRRDIMFIGTYQHPPNRDAVLYFARAIWPALHQRLPDAKFLVVGSSMTDEVRALAGNGIEVLGFVADIDALLRRTRLTIAPLRFGAGLKGKIATSLLAGVPMVASSIAVEGTALADEILIADAPDNFVEAAIRLYTDEALWQRLSVAGFAFAKREYSLQATVPRLRRLLDSIAGPEPEALNRPMYAAYSFRVGGGG